MSLLELSAIFFQTLFKLLKARSPIRDRVFGLFDHTLLIATLLFFGNTVVNVSPFKNKKDSKQSTGLAILKMLNQNLSDPICQISAAESHMGINQLF